MKVALSPIAEADIPAISEFLHRELNQAVPAATWARAMTPSWKSDAPNHGFQLRAGDEVVGALLAFYSRRQLGDRLVDVCNLGAWCVLEEHRSQSFRLMMKVLGQKGYAFTDLSPSGDVPAMNEKLGFSDLDTTTAVIPNLPWPTLPGRTRVSSDPAEVERLVTGAAAEIHRDHAAAPAARHLVISRGGRTCYVVFRQATRKGLPLFASVLYASDPDLLVRSIRPLTRHLLLRHRLPVTLLEAMVTPHRPRWSRLQGTPRRKMYKSAELESSQIDNLYSELVCVPW